MINIFSLQISGHSRTQRSRKITDIPKSPFFIFKWKKAFDDPYLDYDRFVSFMADLAYDGYVRISRHNTFQSSPRLRLVMASGLCDFRTLYSFSEQKNVQIRMAFSNND